MSVLSELASATGDKSSNLELVKRCLVNPAFIHSIAEGLRTGTPPAQESCLEILAEVLKRRGELMAPFFTDIRDATKNKNRKLARQAYAALTSMVEVAPSEVFGERDELLATAAGGGPLGLSAAEVLAALCAHSANYRGKLLVPSLRLLKDRGPKELLRWAKALTPAVNGSVDGIARFRRELAPRASELDAGTAAKLEKLLVSVDRSLPKKTK